MPPDNDDVQKEIEQLEQRYAENSQGLVFAHLADAYRRAGEYGKAEGLVLHGLKNHPNYISAYNVLGRVYLESERYADAHEQFSKVLELDPQNMIAMRALGDLAAGGGRLEDARSWYERLLQIDPRNEEVQVELEKLAAGGVTPPAAAAPVAPEEAPPPAAAADEVTEEVEPVEGATPWELAAEEPVREESGEEIEPVEGLIGKGMPTESGGDVAEAEPELPSALAWEEFSDLEALADEAVEPPVGQVEGLEAFEARAPGEPAAPGAAAEPPAERRQEFDLGDIEDWTPGFLSGEEIEDRAGADLGVESLTEEFREAVEPEAAGEAGETETAGPSPVSEGMVTETMAELYADQGLYEDALAVYRKLVGARPGDERLQARIAELEIKLAEARATPEGSVDLAELLDLAEPSADEAPVPPAAPEIPAVFEAPPITDQPPAGALEGRSETTLPEPEFRFEDEAPVAGIEHLDPFASSFEVMVRREDEPAQQLGQPPEPEIAPAADVVPAGAVLTPPARQDSIPATAAPEPTAPAVTIEEYLSGLLAYSPEDHASASQPGNPGPVAASDPAGPPSETADESNAAEASSSGDLEEFQEWLRGLKE